MLPPLYFIVNSAFAGSPENRHVTSFGEMDATPVSAREAGFVAAVAEAD
jgi:hypothetical protein